MDWIRFWNQLKVDIDNSSMDPGAKFSYLKELLLPKVCMHIDGLPSQQRGMNEQKTSWSQHTVRIVKSLMHTYKILPPCQ